MIQSTPYTQYTDFVLPYSTLHESVASFENKFLVVPSADKRELANPKIWMKFLEDNQNPQCLANIICHLAWRNNDYSKKTCKQLVSYLEEYHDNVYQSAFIVLKKFLGLDDYREDDSLPMNEPNDDDPIDDGSLNQEETQYEIKIFAHNRIDRFLTPIIKSIRDWYRDNKYPQSCAKIAQFIDEMAQTNILVASYFRIKSQEINIQWFQNFLNGHSYYLTLPRAPEFQQ